MVQTWQEAVELELFSFMRADLQRLVDWHVYRDNTRHSCEPGAYLVVKPNIRGISLAVLVRRLHNNYPSLADGLSEFAVDEYLTNEGVV